MITPSFGITATERVLPKLALDFTTASLDSRITFTRTTDATHPATYVNSNGYIVNANNNQPRFDYDPSTLVCKGLLIEESRTNLLSYSDQFDNNIWLKANTSIVTNSTTSPDGSVNSDTVICTAVNDTHRVRQSFGSKTENVNYSGSVFVKPGTHNYVSISINTSASSGAWIEATANLASGVISNSGSGTYGVYISSKITNVGNGWYRLSISGALSLPGEYFLQISISSSATPTYGAFGYESWAANGTETVYLWGAQLEAGAFPTSYIPTTSAALTRNADVATMTGTNFSSWWNATQGTIIVSGVLNGGIAYPVSVDDDTTSNYIQFVNYGTTAQAECTVSGSSTAQLFSTFSGTSFKSSFAYKTDSFAFSSNAQAVQTDSSGAIPTLSVFRISSNKYWGPRSSAIIKTISYYPQRLINAEVQAFSKG